MTKRDLVVKIARKHNIAVPHLETIYALLQAFDRHRRNTGVYGRKK